MSRRKILALKEFGVGDQGSRPDHVVGRQMAERFVMCVGTTSKTLNVLIGGVRLSTTRKHPTGKTVGYRVTTRDGLIRVRERTGDNVGGGVRHDEDENGLATRVAEDQQSSRSAYISTPIGPGILRHCKSRPSIDPRSGSEILTSPMTFALFIIPTLSYHPRF